jgi:hypothetical protein
MVSVVSAANAVEPRASFDKLRMTQSFDKLRMTQSFDKLRMTGVSSRVGFVLRMRS